MTFFFYFSLPLIRDVEKVWKWKRKVPSHQRRLFFKTSTLRNVYPRSFNQAWNQEEREEEKQLLGGDPDLLSLFTSILSSLPEKFFFSECPSDDREESEEGRGGLIDFHRTH